MIYNVLMGTLNPTHSLTHFWPHLEQSLDKTGQLKYVEAVDVSVAVVVNASIDLLILYLPRYFD